MLAQLVRSSDLLGFVTDITGPYRNDDTRIRIPIRDADAHATFYVVAMIDAPRTVLDIVELVRA